jgi:hypothetical protein
VHVLQNAMHHFRVLVPPADVPALVASCCKCKARCDCDPANHHYYNLAVGSGASYQRYHRQRSAIEHELRHPRYAGALERMPYHLHTVAPKSGCPQPIETRVGASKLRGSHAGAVLLGVFPSHRQPAVARQHPGTGGDAASCRAKSVFGHAAHVWRAARLGGHGLTAMHVPVSSGHGVQFRHALRRLGGS